MYYIYIFFVGVADKGYKTGCISSTITQALVDETHLNITLLKLHYSYDSCNHENADAVETQKYIFSLLLVFNFIGFI